MHTPCLWDRTELSVIGSFFLHVVHTSLVLILLAQQKVTGQ